VGIGGALPLVGGAPTKIYWVDAANRFDAHALAKTAQALSDESRAVLSQIQLARTFNAFQLVALVSGKLPRLSSGAGYLRRSSGALL
jgi:chromosome condensin MukBEF ATPase and DNA-binding subunit MukB